VLKDGRRLEKFVEHAVGSAKNPMTDAQLEAKFEGQASSIFPTPKVRRLIDLCWKIEQLSAAAQLARAAEA
jgi:2-methylcitrate dehydratase PrpD